MTHSHNFIVTSMMMMIIIIFYRSRVIGCNDNKTFYFRETIRPIEIACLLVSLYSNVFVEQEGVKNRFIAFYSSLGYSKHCL